MHNTPDPKTIAKNLRVSLSKRHIDISHSAALEIVAAQFGLANWNILAAARSSAPAARGVNFEVTKPIMRIFDEAKAKEFYCGFLGFGLDWEHRFGENFPLYAQISRAGLMIHLSGHHGDASPGSTIVVMTQNLDTYQQELSERDYMFNKPNIEDLPWGLVMTVTDPFSNRIRFTQNRPDAQNP